VENFSLVDSLTLKGKIRQNLISYGQSYLILVVVWTGLKILKFAACKLEIAFVC